MCREGWEERPALNRLSGLWVIAHPVKSEFGLVRYQEWKERATPLCVS